MKTTTKLASLSVLLGFALSCQGIGSFQPATTPPATLGHIILMPDGTVLASPYDTSFTSTSWYRLTPDIHGSYANGTWSNIASANFDRFAYSSVVLQDGRLFVAGGEYGTGNGNTAEIYNPSNNTWTIVSPPVGLINTNLISPNTLEPVRIADAECKVLSNGNVLLSPADPQVSDGTLIYNPTTNGWAAGPPSLNFLGEATMMKLPDNSILTVDANDFSSERYLPASNTWTNDASTSPTSLWAPLGPDFVDETGPAMLLPNGSAVFFGGIGQTAIYTPSGNNGPGSWAAGAPIPGGNVAADAGSAMMFNGKILIATSPQPFVSAGPTVTFPTPTTIYEYDYTAPTNSAYTSVATVNAVPASQSEFADLPDGTVLYGLAGNTTLYVYQPDGSPLAAGKPTILTISTNSNGSLHLTGTLFNGISEGASYGDDNQMDSNFPLVRFIDAFGNVRYGRTYNWSSTGVTTGNAVVSTECVAPTGSSSQDLIEVVANGIASGSVNLNLSPVVTTLSDSGAGSLRQVVSNALSGATITFASGLSGQTITLTSGEVLLNRSVTIDASALPAGIKINGNHNSRIFNVTGATTVTLNALTITNGYVGAANGGGIENGGTLTMNNCTIAGNATDINNAGGAIDNPGTLIMTGCTLAGNSSAFAGAIQNDASCSLVNCTFANNSALVGNGGAIDNVGGSLSVTQCTFSGNSAAASVGGAIDNFEGQVTVVNSIMANNNSDDFYNWPTSSLVIFQGNNLVEVPIFAGGTPIIEGAIISVDPMLGPLANNGGPTLTMMPQAGSPVIDFGVTSAAAGITYDQRGPGFPRVVGAAVDLGAVEVPVPLTVFTTSDSGYGSLRYAGTYATNGSTITFAPALSGQTITLTSGEIPVNESCVIDGSSLSNPIQVNGNHSSRIFDVGGGATVTINSLVITNGNITSAAGGGVQNGGTLTMNNCTLAGNSTDSSDTGGAIYNYGAITLSGCTLAGNSGGFGGAIGQYGNCSLVNCTFANNSVSANGGAIDNVDGTLGVTQCTFSGNSAGTGGAIDNFEGQVTLVNSILANNGEDFYNWPSTSEVIFAGNNIVEEPVIGGGIPIIEGEIIELDPMLGPLANNGGPTLTMLPQPGSPAINAGLTSGAAGITYDQRGPGFPRVVGAAVDIGAVEVQTIFGTPPLLTGTALTNGAFGFSFTNVSGASFTVFTTTNIALPLSNWSSLGSAVESPLGSGHYQFTDPQAGSSPQRFYEVTSP